MVFDLVFVSVGVDFVLNWDSMTVMAFSVKVNNCSDIFVMDDVTAVSVSVIFDCRVW